MIPFSEIENLPEYQAADPAKRDEVKRQYGIEFWNEVSKDPSYQSAPPEEKESLHQAFDRQFGPGIRPVEEEDPEQKSFLLNMYELVKSGGSNTMVAAKIADDVLKGEIDKETAVLLADSISQDARTKKPKELEELYNSIKGPSEEFDKAHGFSESAKAVWDMVKSATKQVFTNPAGMAYMTAEQAGNMVPGMAGMVGGAKAGAAIGTAAGPGSLVSVPAAAAIGGVVGGFLGQWGVEAGSEFKGMVAKELQERKLAPTEDNILAILADDNFLSKTVSSARKKATATSAVSVAMNMASGRIAAAPFKAAQEQAIAQLGEAATKESVAELTKSILKSRTIAQKVKAPVGAYVTNVAEEGVSEAAGQKAGYGKVDLGEVALETLGGIGGSVMETPAAAYSFGKDFVTDRFGNRVETPLVEPQAEPVPTPDDILESETLDDAIDNFRKSLTGVGEEEVNLEGQIPSTAEESAQVFQESEPTETERRLNRQDELEDVFSALPEEVEPKPSTAQESAAAFEAAGETPVEKRVKRQEDIEAALEAGLRPSTVEESAKVFEQSPVTKLEEQLRRREEAGDWTETQYSEIPREKVAQKEGTESAIASRESDFTAAKGKPFKTEKSLQLSAKQRGLDLNNYRVIPVQDGFIAIPKPTGMSDAQSEVYWSEVSKRVFPEDWTAADERALEEARIVAGKTPTESKAVSEGLSEKTLRDSASVKAPSASTLSEETSTTPLSTETIENEKSVAVGQEVNTTPTEPMKKAGNYKKAHVTLDGMDISIENPVGTIREGVDENGKEWSTEMKSDYGYIKGTTGFDKDHLDVFVKPGYEENGGDVFVVNQYNDKGKFDEHKPVFGAKSEEEAMQIYNSNYDKGWKGGKSVVRMTSDQFKAWAHSEQPRKGPAKVQERSKTTAEELAGIEIPDNAQVEVTAVRGKTGKKMKVMENAKDAIERIDKTIEKYYELLGCIQS